MPMRWTPENDQTLLLKILETSNINVDTKAIASLWPEKEGEPKPTPRAITERLVKIREQCRASGSGGFSVSSSQSKKPRTGPTGSGVSKPSTPRKPRVKKDEPNFKADPDADACQKLPDLIPSSSGWSSSDSSNPLTPATSSRKRPIDLLATRHGLDGSSDLYGSDLHTETPSKKVKAFSFPGPAINLDFAPQATSQSFNQHYSFLDDAAF